MAQLIFSTRKVEHTAIFNFKLKQLKEPKVDRQTLRKGSKRSLAKRNKENRDDNEQHSISEENI